MLELNRNFDNSKLEKSYLLENIDVETNKDRNTNFWKNIIEARREDVKQDSGIPEKFYSEYKERFDFLPKNGIWEGDVGESKFKSFDKETNRELAKYGLDGIIYKNCVPDFSKCSILTDKIDKITTNKVSNFQNFCSKLVVNGKFLKKRDVLDFKKDHKLAFHECSDGKTCMLIPEKIHKTFKHSGGRFECSCRENRREKFDE